jgi:hypothetical protein
MLTTYSEFDKAVCAIFRDWVLIYVWHLWTDYLREDLKLIAERKLLRHKLIGVRRQVTLEITQTFLCLEVFEGKVTPECEALGLCANEVILSCLLDLQNAS